MQALSATKSAIISSQYSRCIFYKTYFVLTKFFVALVVVTLFNVVLF